MPKAKVWRDAKPSWRATTSQLLLAPQWRWRFALVTDAETQWSEAQIHASGWPRDPIYCLAVTADCPMPFGCFTAHRTVNHHHAAKFFATEARRIVDDIQSEFAPRLRQL